MKPIVKSKYEIYLESEQFADLRKKVLRRDNNKCRACGSTENLQVHHLSYKNIYHEELDDLVCLCRNCHAAFHAVNELQKFYDELHEYKWQREMEERREQREKEIEDNRKKHEEERERIESIENEIVEEIKDEYSKQDYVNNGDFDMTDWSVLNPIIESKCREKGIDGWFSKKTELRNWFLYRRYAMLLRCIEKNLSFNFVRDHTKYDSSWLYKWYRKEKLISALKQELFINNIKEVEQ